VPLYVTTRFKCLTHVKGASLASAEKMFLIGHFYGYNNIAKPQSSQNQSLNLGFMDIDNYQYKLKKIPHQLLARLIQERSLNFSELYKFQF